MKYLLVVSLIVTLATVLPAAGSSPDYQRAGREGGRDPLDQGGETCAEATVIVSLPFCATGTTAGYANDYNAPGICGNSFGPDVVYRYTATASGLLTATLCESSFNTVLWVRRSGCPGPFVVCNDDSCGPQGEQSCVTFSAQADTVYFLIVDGLTASDAGDYVISVHTGAGCDVQCPCPYPSLEFQPNYACILPDLPVIQCGDTICGTVAAGEEDFYELIIPVGQSYIVTIDVFGDDTPGYFPFGQGLDPQVCIYEDGCGGEVTCDFSGGVGDDARLEVGCLGPGDYEISVLGSGATSGPYILALECQSCTDSCVYPNIENESLNDDCITFADDISCTETVCGEIVWQGHLDTDYYKFTIAEGQCKRVTLDVFGDSTAGMYPFGRGYDPIVSLAFGCCVNQTLADNIDGVSEPDLHLELGCLSAGDYWIGLFQGYTAADSVNAGPYILALTCEPCECCTAAVCPPNSIPEGEPCPNFPDNFNNGCYSSPPAFTEVECGETICASSYWTDAANYDTDIFLHSVTEPESLVITMRAEFSFAIAFYAPEFEVDCSSQTVYYGFIEPSDCVTRLFFFECLTPGIYKFSVEPLECSVFECEPYFISFDCYPCCVDSCPPLASGEGEECPFIADLFNGGCDVVPQGNYSAITCDETVCGELFYSYGERYDRDWYVLEITELDSIRWCAASELPFELTVFEISGGCDNLDTVGFAASDTCDVACIASCVPPGTYAFKISAPPEINLLMDCYSYTAWLVCLPCQPCTYPSRDREPENDNCYSTIDTIFCGDTLCGVIDNTLYEEDNYIVSLPPGQCTRLTIDIFGNSTPGFYPYGKGYDPTGFAEVICCGSFVNLDYDDNEEPDVHRVFSCVRDNFVLKLQPSYHLSNSIGPYMIVLACEPCECCLSIECPDSAIAENEPCPNYPDQFNRGCGSDPPSFSEIQCGQTICGTGYSDGYPVYDKDLYLLEVLQPESLRVCLTAGFDASLSWGYFGALPSCSSYFEQFGPNAHTCETKCVNIACAQPGFYGFKVSTGICNPVACVSYFVSVECAPCCLDTCPPGTVAEGEPCPNSVDLNAGCDEYPNQFTPIECNSAICGSTYYTDDLVVSFDRDWYQLQLADSDSVRWCATATYPFKIALYDISAGCTNLDTLATAVGDSCEFACVAACLDPGTYAMSFAARDDIACGGYSGLLWCTPCSYYCPEPDSVVIHYSGQDSMDVELHWPAVPGASGYRIYGDTDSDVELTAENYLATVGTNSYTDAGIVAVESRKFYAIVSVCGPW